MYKLEVARIKISNLVSKSKFINTDQMCIDLFPKMHLYALHMCNLVSPKILTAKLSMYKRVVNLDNCKETMKDLRKFSLL
jgi:hypothetical protein